MGGTRVETCFEEQEKRTTGIHEILKKLETKIDLLAEMLNKRIPRSETEVVQDCPLMFLKSEGGCEDQMKKSKKEEAEVVQDCPLMFLKSEGGCEDQIQETRLEEKKMEDEVAVTIGGETKGRQIRGVLSFQNLEQLSMTQERNDKNYEQGKAKKTEMVAVDGGRKACHDEVGEDFGENTEEYVEGNGNYKSFSSGNGSNVAEFLVVVENSQIEKEMKAIAMADLLKKDKIVGMVVDKEEKNGEKETLAGLKQFGLLVWDPGKKPKQKEETKAILAGKQGFLETEEGKEGPMKVESWESFRRLKQSEENRPILAGNQESPKLGFHEQYFREQCFREQCFHEQYLSILTEFFSQEEEVMEGNQEWQDLEIQIFDPGRENSFLSFRAGQGLLFFKEGTLKDFNTGGLADDVQGLAGGGLLGAVGVWIIVKFGEHFGAEMKVMFGTPVLGRREVQFSVGQWVYLKIQP